MLAAADPSFHMWFVLATIVGAIVLYASDKLPIEVTSVVVISVLLIVFEAFPVMLPGSDEPVGPRQLLAGFADPALIAIIALLILGQAMVQTGALDGAARQLVTWGSSRPFTVVVGALLVVTVISGLLNNTPVVVIFIPIMAALASQLPGTVSRVMIPLSYAAILGGNLTLIGSSTNLLVAGSFENITETEFGFFTITIPGAMLSAIGFIYVLLIAPRLLKDRAGMAGELVSGEGKQFIVQLEVTADSKLEGQKAVAGMFPGLPNLTVRMIQRGERAMLPPYDEIELKPGDTLVVAATRPALTEVLTQSPGLMKGVWESGGAGGDSEASDRPMPGSDRMLAEAVVAPASRMDGRTLAQIGFHHQTNCIVLGIQRRSRMFRAAMNTIRLEAGDVLLIMGGRQDVFGLRNNRDVLLMQWSASDFPATHHSGTALTIFGLVVAFAASGLTSITVTAMIGVGLLLLTGCLNVRQAGRAVDRRVVLMVGAALAMGTALSATGGASYLAHELLAAMEGAGPAAILSAFFLLVAILTNVLSNNATAVLFTPIALSVANQLGIDPLPFVVAVIFAANCSFATPIGYQTNLLVMGPGHYRFSDFFVAGAPLIIVMWISFTILAPWYYGLM